MKPKIDKEFQSLIPPLQDHEFRQLKENILRDGCTHPIDVWNGVIIDGHNRYKICDEAGIPFAVNEMEFADRDEAKIWIIKNQFGRRNLIPFHRAELALVLKPLIAAKAKERQGQRNDLNIRENSHECSEQGRTDETLAQISGISTNSIRRAETIKEHGTPEQIERARAGGRGNTINAIYTEIRHRDITEKACPMCGKTLPIDRFYGEGATCKTCTEIRKQALLNVGTVSYEALPQPQKKSSGCHGMNAIIKAVAESMRGEPKSVEHTIEDLAESLQLLKEDFLSKVRRSIQIYRDDFGVDDRQTVCGILEETVTELHEIMGEKK